MKVPSHPIELHDYIAVSLLQASAEIAGQPAPSPGEIQKLAMKAYENASAVLKAREAWLHSHRDVVGPIEMG